VAVHVEPWPVGEMQRHLCTAKGLVHFAREDANPRIVYEAMLAGLPVFTTYESNLPPILVEQEFMTVVHSQTAPRSSSNRKTVQQMFQRFMEDKVRQQRNVAERIWQFVDKELAEDRAFHPVCVKMGICEP